MEKESAVIESFPLEKDQKIEYDPKFVMAMIIRLGEITDAEVEKFRNNRVEERFREAFDEFQPEVKPALVLIDGLTEEERKKFEAMADKIPGFPGMHEIKNQLTLLEMIDIDNEQQ